MNEDKTYIMFIIIVIIIVMLFTVMFSLSCEADEIDDLIPFIIKIESNGNPYAVSNAGAVGLMQITPKGALAEWNNEYKRIDEKLWNENYPTGILDRNVLIYFGIDINCPKQEYSVRDLLNGETNIKIGEWYLRRLKNHYLQKNYTIERMLASYNGGPTRMRHLLRQGKDWQDMPKESVRYVKKVLKLYNSNH